MRTNWVIVKFMGLALLTLVWPFTASSQSSIDAIECRDGDVLSGTYADVAVNGISCTLDGATVHGSVLVGSGRLTTTSRGAAIFGGIQVKSGGDIVLRAVDVMGEVTLEQSGNLRVVAGEVSPPTEAEDEAVTEGLRLACQTRVLGDVRVDVPPDSITALQRVQVEGHERPIELDPVVHAVDVTLEPASLSDLRADATRLEDALSQHPINRSDHDVLRQAPRLLREGVFDLNGKLPVNTDGGLMSRGHPLGATSLAQVIEIYRQIREEAGPRQVPGANIGLAHAMGAGPNSSIVILKR